MIFKKGSRVEVFNKKEVPSGSWWCGEIILGNGHTYTVRYDRSFTDTCMALEGVPRKAVRPCPPFVENPRWWVHGDIFEVFDNHTWKLAEVSKVLGRNSYSVRILGSSMELRVHSSYIRIRQSWRDNKWVVINKDCGKFNGGMLNILPKEGNFICWKTDRCSELNNCAEGRHLIAEDINSFSDCFSKDAKKRLHMSSLPLERCAGAGKKLRTINKERSYKRMIAESSSKLCEKVDAVASSQNILHEEYMHASLNNIKTCSSEIQKGERVTDSDGNRYFRVHLEPTESVSSSVGSCSANTSPHRFLNCLDDSLIQDLDSRSGDTETSSLGRDLSLPTGEALGEDIHQLELHAYRTTLKALYASGPISWDQEALISNLRCLLHVSNDEHLLEVRNLVSTEKEYSCR